jgi:putative NADH-flavin reductase
MKIALFGAGGAIGQSIAEEALSRGHQVTAVVRDPSKFKLAHEKLTVVKGDAASAESVAKTVTGHDAAISAVGPTGTNTEQGFLVEVAQALIKGLAKAGMSRLVVVGGAGSLEVAPGLQLVDAPAFPAAYRGIALAHRDSLDVFRTADLDWTYISPAALIEPGERTGRYRKGTTQLITDEQENSRISIPDYAIALLDEVENATLLRSQMTVAY